MNTSKWLMAAFMAISATIIVASCAAPKNTTAKTPVNVNVLVNDQQYVFHAESVSPASGRTRQLTSEYSLNVSKESVVSFLPYFGRAYATTMGSEGGIKFNSTRFEYIIIENKKGKWDISIKPTDVADIRQLNLSIFENGSATLQVLSNNRQSISFRGFIDQKTK